MSLLNLLGAYSNPFIFIQSPLFFIPLMLLAAFLRGFEQFKRTLMFIIVISLLTYLFKYIYAVERHCEVDCFIDYAFPSGHAALAFGGAFSFYPHTLYLFFFLYAIFVSLARVYLGVHSFEDVFGGYAFSLFVFLLFARGKRFKGQHNEFIRQISHLLIGLFFAFLYVISKELLVVMLMAFTSILMFYSAYLVGLFPILKRLERLFERTTVFFGYGALNFLTGVLFSSLFIQDEVWAFASILVLSLADGLSTIVGKYMGKRELIDGKTVEGTVTFFIVSVFIIQYLSLPLWMAFFSTVVELFSKRLGMDDNLSICMSFLIGWFLGKM